MKFKPLNALLTIIWELFLIAIRIIRLLTLGTVGRYWVIKLVIWSFDKKFLIEYKDES